MDAPPVAPCLAQGRVALGQDEAASLNRDADDTRGGAARF